MAYQAKLAKAAIAAPPVPPGEGDLQALLLAEKAARQSETYARQEVDEVSASIDRLRIEGRNRRGPFAWLGRRRDDADVSDLLRRRDALKARAETLSWSRIRAEDDVRRAGRERALAEAQAVRDHEAKVAAATKRLSVLHRAGMLLSRVPALAYVGVRRLIAMAARIEAARERGFDPGQQAWSHDPGKSNP